MWIEASTVARLWGKATALWKSQPEKLGDSSQICLSDGGFGASFEGFWGTGWYETELAEQLSIGGILEFDP